jgi:hypothetical protein
VMLTRAMSGIGNDVEASLSSLSRTLSSVLATGGVLSSEEIVVRESLNGRIVSKRIAKIDDKGNLSFEPHPTFQDVGDFMVPPFKATASIR